MEVDQKKILEYAATVEAASNRVTQRQRNINVFNLTDVHADMQELAGFIERKLQLKFSDTEKAAKVMLAAALYFYGQEEMNLELIKTLFDENTKEDIKNLRKIGISQFIDGSSPINIAMRAFEAAGINDDEKSSKELVEEMQELVK